MKNMFFVINKEKVYAYVVSIVTIVILFFMSHVLNSDLNTVEETYTNVEQNTNSQNNTISNTLNDVVSNNWFNKKIYIYIFWSEHKVTVLENVMSITNYIFLNGDNGKIYKYKFIILIGIRYKIKTTRI